MFRIYKNILSVILCATLFCTQSPAQTLSEGAQVSLLSCSSGAPLYYHYGHSAIRIQDPACTAPDGSVMPIDWTFNYGIFNFNTEHFYLKFVKGETDYMLGMEYTTDFVYGAGLEDREVSYQPLRLTAEEKQAILDALLVNYRPENRYYRYNFVYDNCATRAWHVIRNAIHYPEAQGTAGRTWRENIAYYSGRYTWGRFGIDLLFGYEADREMSVEEALFLPENLMNYVSEQGLSEDEVIHSFTPRDGQFATSPEFCVVLLLLLVCAFTLYDYTKGRFSWGADVALGILYSILGTIIFTLYFFSTHPFVGSNMNILLVNPLWVAVVVMLCISRSRGWLLKAAPYLAIYAVICFGVLLCKGQTVHTFLALPVAHIARLYILNKRTQHK